MVTRLAPLLALAALAGACSAQIYPWGPETQWTRQEWPALRLPFTFRALRKAALDEGAELHSLNGPFSLAQQERAEAEAPPRPGFAGRRPAGGGKAALLRCSVCNIAVTSVWETARQVLHQTGEGPTRGRLAQLVASSCNSEIPAIMRALRAVSKGSQGAGGGGALPPAAADSGQASGVAATCLAVFQAGAGEAAAEESVQLGALQRGLRQYAAQLNGQHSSGGSRGIAFEELAERAACLDLHSECRKWAARGECQRNPLYMVGLLSKEQERYEAGHCRFSCGVCLAPLPSGELPSVAAAAAASARWLEDATFHACNASGICEGVDPGVLPVVATLPAGGRALRQAPRPRGERGGGAPPSAAAAAPAESAAELRRLALALPRDQCFYTNAGWWTYEVCLERHIKQFHMDLETVRLEQQLLLGSWAQPQPADVTDAARTLDAALLPPGLAAPPEGLPYISQAYTGGSSCLLEAEGTEIQREAELRLACSPDADAHLLVSEPEHCRYLVVLLSPQLCPRRSLEPAHDAGLEGLHLLRQEL